MTDNLKKAKETLLLCDFTCVLFDGKSIYSSKKRGVKPLIELLESKICFDEYSAADKVIGAGAAHLYALLKVKSVWAKVISDHAKQIIMQNKIEVFCETQVHYIINRTGDGVCPIESCVKDIKSSNLALDMIKAKLKELLDN